MNDQNTDMFVENLVKAIVGKEISNLPGNEQEEVRSKCIGVFVEYIVNYFQEMYSQADAKMIQDALAGSSNVFENEDFGKKFDIAYESFLDDLERSLENVDIND